MCLLQEAASTHEHARIAKRRHRAVWNHYFARRRTVEMNYTYDLDEVFAKLAQPEAVFGITGK